jgi:hypothetical protein
MVLSDQFFTLQNENRLKGKQMTKQQKEEIDIRARLDFQTQYLPVVMDLLRRCSEHAMNIRVDKKHDFVIWYDEGCFVLPYKIQDVTYHEGLDCLQSYLDRLDDLKREQDRIQNIRSGALAKLNNEEIKVLGIR